jgi:phage terminase small subunit
VAAYVGPAAANGSAAAIFAGYKPSNARFHAVRLARRRHVQAAIQQEQDRLAKDHAVTQDRVIAELARIAFFDIRNLFDKGRLKAIEELDDDTAAVITRYDRTMVDDVERVRLAFADKNAALITLCRTLGVFKDKINVPFDIEDLFRREQRTSPPGDS